MNSINTRVAGLYVASSNEQLFTLKHTQVSAKISANLSRVEVIQSFANPLKYQPAKDFYSKSLSKG